MKQELEYIKINSSIHKLNPTFKLLYLFLYLVICFLPHQIEYISIASFVFSVNFGKDSFQILFK